MVETKARRRSPLDTSPPDFDITEFIPHEGQLEALKDDNKRKIITSANRWGKSYYGVAECLYAARGVHPWRPTRRPAKQVWICCPSYESFDKVQMPIFEQLCPKSWLRVDHHGNTAQFNKSDHYVDIKWDAKWGPGHCRIWVLTYEQNPKTWVGAAVNYAWMDEPPPRPHMMEIFARLRSARGSLLATFTPVDGIGWWHEAIWKPAKIGQNGWYFQQAALAERNPSTPTNEFEVGRILVPHFRVPYRGEDPETGERCTCPTPASWGSCIACRREVIEMARDFPDLTDREIRVFGEVKGKQGLIYPMYDEAVHLIPRFKIPVYWPLYGGIDPGFHGFHCTIGAISPDEELVVADELFSQRETTNVRFDKLVTKVRALRPKPEDWQNPKAAVVPFAVDTEDPQVVLELNTRALEVMARQEEAEEDIIIMLAFAPIEQGQKAVKAGILRKQQMLQPNPEKPTPSWVARKRPKEGEPDIYLFDDLYCEWQGPDQYYRRGRLDWEYGQYSWKEPVQNSTLKRDEPNKDQADGAHGMDSKRYLVMSRFGPSVEAKARARQEEGFRADEELTNDQRREKRKIQALLKRLDEEREEEQRFGGEWEEDDEYEDDYL